MLRSASCRITSALAFTAVLSLAAPASARSPTKAKIDELIAQLSTSGPETRARAAEQPGVAKALKDSERDVRRAAAPALRRMGLSDPETYVRTSVVQALARMGAPGVAMLIEALPDQEWLVRWWAAHTLGRLGAVAKPAPPALRHALKDSTEMSREAIRHAIEDIEGAKDTGTAESSTPSSKGADP